MKTPNANGKHPDNMALLEQQASACGPGCGCQAVGTPGRNRWVIGAIVLVAAGVMVVKAMVKSDGKTTQAAAPAFATPVASPAVTGTGSAVASSDVAAPVAETSVGTAIGGFAELDTLAAQTDVVFIFLPGKDGTSGNPPVTTIKTAAQTIESKAGIKCGLFTLKAGTSDYTQIAAQMAVPGVITLVKGKGMRGLSGEITESKLLQAFVAASSAASCAPSAGASCCPK